MSSADGLDRYGWHERWQERYREVTSDLGRTIEAASVGDGPAVGNGPAVGSAPTGGSGPGGTIVWQPGRVVRHDGAGLVVATAQGPVRAMFGPAVDPAPVVGDWVVLDATPHPVATLPRESLLRRRAAGKEEREQPLVANVDLVLVVCGLDRPVRGGRIQRTVAIAVDAGAESLVVLTKADKVAPSVAIEAELAAQEAQPGIEAVTLSAKGGWGVGDLIERIGHRTVALIGESGAGKSTLVNALVAGEVALEGEVREGDAKGRHTTTHRELHLLPDGGILVDTPGIREVGIWTDADTVDESFADIDELAAGCRFRDCVHDREPGCAVRAAVDGGTLPEERLDAWRALQAEAAAAEVRADVVEQRRRARQFGRIAREAQKAKDDLRER